MSKYVDESEPDASATESAFSTDNRDSPERHLDDNGYKKTSKPLFQVSAVDDKPIKDEEEELNQVIEPLHNFISKDDEAMDLGHT